MTDTTSFDPGFYPAALESEAFGIVPLFSLDNPAPRRDPGLRAAFLSLDAMIRTMDIAYGPPMQWQMVVFPGTVAEKVAA